MNREQGIEFFLVPEQLSSVKEETKYDMYVSTQKSDPNYHYLGSEGDEGGMSGKGQLGDMGETGMTSVMGEMGETVETGVIKFDCCEDSLSKMNPNLTLLSSDNNSSYFYPPNPEILVQQGVDFIIENSTGRFLFQIVSRRIDETEKSSLG